MAIIALREKRSTTISADGSTITHTRTTTPSSTTSGRLTSRPTPSTTRPSTPSTSPTGSAPTTAAELKAVPLVVLNNTRTANLARNAARRFESGGWTVTSTGNLTNNIISTCAYFDPDVANAEQAALALRSEYPTIKRVVPKFAQLPSGPIVVVLTSDYSPS